MFISKWLDTVLYPPIQEELRIQRDISHSYLHLCILQCHFYFYAHPVLWRRVLIGWARNCNEWKSHLFALYDCWNFPLLPQMFCQTNLFDISPLCLFICTLTLFWYGAVWLNWMSAELQLERMNKNATMQRMNNNNSWKFHGICCTISIIVGISQICPRCFRQVFQVFVLGNYTLARWPQATKPGQCWVSISILVHIKSTLFAQLPNS